MRETKTSTTPFADYKPWIRFHHHDGEARVPSYRSGPRRLRGRPTPRRRPQPRHEGPTCCGSEYSSCSLKFYNGGKNRGNYGTVAEAAAVVGGWLCVCCALVLGVKNKLAWFGSEVEEATPPLTAAVVNASHWCSHRYLVHSTVRMCTRDTRPIAC
jgi:hypothetical protein